MEKGERVLRVSVRLLSLLWISLVAYGCGTIGIRSDGADQPQPIIPPKHPVSQYVDPDANYQIDIYDPWEPFNRTMYKFNAKFDDYVFMPAVNFYETITPNFVEDRISNFFSNVRDLRNLINAILQLKLETSLNTGARLVYNTTFGILGLWDPATFMGIPQQREDFGQTLGHYGVGKGPYLVLPVLGPSNLRDTTGLVTDTVAFSAIDPLNFKNYTLRGVFYTLLNGLDTRQRTEFQYYETGSPFEYDLVRLLYTRFRQIEIEK